MVGIDVYPTLLDGYFAIANSSSTASSFQVKDKICYSDEEQFSSTIRQCVYCPTGTLRNDGTCDWPLPVMTAELIKTELAGYTAGQACAPDELNPWGYFLGEDKCSYNITCEGGSIQGGFSENPFIMTSWDYSCQSIDGEYVVYQYAPTVEATLTCVNQENEKVEVKLTCP